MFSIGEQINRKKNKTTRKNKRQRNGPKYSNYLPKVTLFSNINNKEERISLTEHTNILNEYEEELSFLGIKRKNSNNILTIDNNEEIHNNNINNNSNSKLIRNDEQNKEDNSIKISDLYKLYHNLFIKSGIDGSKPSNFIYYLLNDINDSLLTNKRNNKINFGDIKKMILKLPNEEPENSLINILINEYYHSDFNGNSMEKLITKINNSLINQDKNKIFLKNSNDINSNNNNNNNIYYINDDDDKNDIDTIDKSSKTKKDKLKYSNIFNEKMNKNNYLSCLSLTNDSEYFKSFLFVYNKYLKETNLKDENLENSLKINKQKLKSFNEENKEIANEVDKTYLNNILKNKKLRKYISKKFINFQKCNKNKILNILDKYNFNYIGKLLIDNKIENLNKLKTFNNLNNQSFDKEDISIFLTFILFFIDITLINNSSNISPKNDLSLLFPFFNYFKQLDINIKKPQKLKKRINKGNKIKIKLDNALIKEFYNDKIKNKEKKKVETENIYHNKFSFNNNEYQLKKNEENKINNIIEPIKKNSSLLKVHNSNKGTSIDNDRIINNINMNENEKNSNKLIVSYLKNENNRQNQNNKNMEENNLNNFRNKLLKKLSFCHDIFKLNSSQNNENNLKNIYEKQEENSDNLMKIKEDNFINTNNNYKVKLLEKNGNKIIIYEDELSEDKNL